MLKRLLCLLLPSLLALSLCGGCQDARAASSQILALNVGLDVGESRAIRLTVQLPEVGSSGSGGGGGSDSPSGSDTPSRVDQSLVQNGYVLTQVEGDTVADCLTMLTTALPREVTFLHIRGLYFSESFARSGQLFQALTALLQPRLTRPGATVYLCLGRAEDVLKAQTPFLGTRLSKSQDSRQQELQSISVVPDALLVEVYNRLLGQGADAVAVLAAVNNGNAMEASLGGGEQPADYLAGELPYNSISPMSYFGSAVFRGAQPALFLTGYETQLMNLCLGNFQQGTIEVRDESAGRSLSLHQNKAPSISVDLDGETPLVRIRLELEASAYVNTQLEDPQLLRQRAEALLTEDLTQLLLRLQQAGCDPLDLEGHARMHALTNRQWQQMEWDLAYPTACFSVQVQLTLRANAATIP